MHNKKFTFDILKLSLFSRKVHCLKKNKKVATVAKGDDLRSRSHSFSFASSSSEACFPILLLNVVTVSHH